MVYDSVQNIKTTIRVNMWVCASDIVYCTFAMKDRFFLASNVHVFLRANEQGWH